MVTQRIARWVSFLIACGAAAVVWAQAMPAPEAWQALEANDPGRAAAIFRQALERSPSDPILHYGAGVAAMLLGRENDAITELTRALQLEPRLTPASKLLGQLQYRQGDVDAAASTYERALAYAKTDPELRDRLDVWQKERALHKTLVHRNTGRFSIVFEGRADRALADHALATLDAAYWRISQSLGAYSSSAVTVTLYTEQQFFDITGAPSWSAGQFDGRIRIPASGALRSPESFNRVLTHELTHAVIYGLAPRHVPTWLHKGLASYFEPRDAATAAARLSRSRIGLVPFELLEGGFSRLNAQQAALAYTQSLVMADALMARIGSRMAIVLQALDRGQSLEQSLQSLSLSVALFKQDVEARVAGKKGG